jgi:ankyrin repeat protein
VRRQTFNLFTSLTRTRVLQASVRSLQIAKETQKTPNFGTISKQMGSEYRELSVAEKQPYVDKAAKAKSKYVKVTAAYEKLKADGQAAGGYTGKNLAECGGHQAVVSGLRALVLEQMKNRMMLAAAKEGDCDKLRELFDDGGVAHNMDALVKCEDLGEETIYTTVLLQAVKSDRHDVVQLLLDRKVDLNAAEGVKRPWNPRCGETPLIAAAARGHLHILETLLKHEPDIEAVDHREHGQETAYHKACSSGHADCAVALARAGCDTEYVNGDLMTGTTLADSNGHSEVLDKLRAMVLEQLQMSRDPNASHHAIVRHHEQLATEFLVRDSINDKIGLMYRLLKAGADPDKVVRLASLCIEVTDSYPFEEATPLMAAAFSGRHSAIQLLLEYEADINLKIEEYYSSGHSAFHCACYAGQTECAVALLNASCDTSLLAPSEKLDEGLKTGWDMARENGHETLIEQCKKAQDGPRATLPSEADETERTKRATANRKKKARKKAKKAALLSSHSESEPAPEPEPEADMDIRALAESTPNSDTIVESHAETGSEAQPEPEPQPDAEGEVSGHDDTLSCVPTAVHVPTVSLQVESQLNKPELDERAHQLHALAELSVHQWSATQVLEWIVLIDLPPEGASAVSTVMESLDLDGEELLDLGPKILQKKLVKYGTPDAEVLAKQVLAQRDALLQPEDDTFSDNHDDLTATMNVLMMKVRVRVML